MLQVLYTKTMNRAILAGSVIVVIAVMMSVSMMPAHAGVIEVEIDIKPGSDPNSINTNSMGLVAVAILSSVSFDATQVDVTTLAFGPEEQLRNIMVILRTLIAMG